MEFSSCFFLLLNPSSDLRCLASDTRHIFLRAVPTRSVRSVWCCPSADITAPIAAAWRYLMSIPLTNSKWCGETRLVRHKAVNNDCSPSSGASSTVNSAPHSHSPLYNSTFYSHYSNFIIQLCLPLHKYFKRLREDVTSETEQRPAIWNWVNTLSP